MSNRIDPVPEPPPRAPLRRCSYRFLGVPQNVRAARDWLATRLAMARVPDEPAGSALLLLSELATSAIRHTASGAEGGVFHVRAHFFHEGLRVEVGDEGGTPFPAELIVPDPAAEHGRGLLLTATLADIWGPFDSGRGPGVFFQLHWGSKDTLSAAPLPYRDRRRRHWPDQLTPVPWPRSVPGGANLPAAEGERP
ncbi:ATP-binding protein [Allosalinactinospora lopnorensis]|uniref:ATP-binding protein n=1 Tax=Allosalinactinospora lopnorensis TaxID=1352348 RepID=UPI000696AE0F|nr:ATP-binding protein [Allosalinactinospora lopnorensis]